MTNPFGAPQHSSKLRFSILIRTEVLNRFNENNDKLHIHIPSQLSPDVLCAGLIRNSSPFISALQSGCSVWNNLFGIVDQHMICPFTLDISFMICFRNVTKRKLEWHGSVCGEMTVFPGCLFSGESLSFICKEIASFVVFLSHFGLPFFLTFSFPFKVDFSYPDPNCTSLLPNNITTLP